MYIDTFWSDVAAHIADDVAGLIEYEENMVTHKSRSEQKRLKVQKDPRHLAKSTKVHRDASVYVRPTAADTQEYIDALNDGWDGDMSDENN